MILVGPTWYYGLQLLSTGWPSDAAIAALEATVQSILANSLDHPGTPPGLARPGTNR